MTDAMGSEEGMTINYGQMFALFKLAFPHY